MESIVKFATELGFNIDNIVCDGNIHRFKDGHDDEKKSGWYAFHQNYSTSNGKQYYSGNIGSWKSGMKHTFVDDIKLTKSELDTIKRNSEQAKKRAAAEQAKLHEATKIEAQTIWAGLSEGISQYHTKKGLKVHAGARLNGKGAAVVPMKDAQGEIWNLQYIYPDGTKRFLPSGRTKDLFYTIGHVNGSAYICEGFATTVSVHEAIESGAVCAFSASNLEAVAKEFAKNSKVIICGDNDATGIEKGQAAAEATGGKFIAPELEGLDFNDVGNSLVVRNRIMGIKPQERAEPSEQFIVNTPYPHESDKGIRLATIENISTMIDRLGINVRYNLITKEEEIIIPSKSYSLDNKANATFSEIFSWCKKCKIPTDGLEGYLTSISDQNPYNPITTWIDSKPWDGTSRLGDFYATITAKGESDYMVKAMKEHLIKTWLISAVAAAYEPNGVSAHGVLVFQGAQYMGKTKWFKKLIPQDMGLTADGVILRPDDKDSILGVIGKWLVELGELDATFKKSDISQLKAFITKDKDIIRRPFSRKESFYVRRTIFFASVNETNFLNDTTGNRRFWTIECEKINFDHSLDMQQVWAEVKTLYSQGQPWVLSAEAVIKLNEHNEKFQTVDPVEERISEGYNWEEAAVAKWLKASQVCIEVGILNPNVRDMKSACRILRKLSKLDPKVTKNGTLFAVPSRK